MAANSFFFKINIQFENLGDLLINRELIKLAGAHGRVIVDVSKCPSYFIDDIRDQKLPHALLLISSVAFFRELLLERLRKRRCYYFLCPGGVSGQMQWREFARKLALLPVFFLLSVIGLRICQLGVSYERINPLYAAYLKLRASAIAFHFVRDNHSLSQLQMLDIPHDGVLPDLAFALFGGVSPSDLIRNVCLSFRTDQNAMQLDRVKRFICELLKALPLETNIYLLAQVRWDAPGMKDLQAWLAKDHGRKSVLQVNCESVEQNMAFLRQCDIVFANRLHMLLLGASQCGRMVACIDEHNTKIRGLFETLGLSDAVLTLDSVLTREQVEKAAAVIFDGAGEARKLRDGLQRIVASR
ncbi:putative Polysaccharide pyruvyl transferase family protein [Gammaproteobacteria bacterium]